MFKQSSSFLLVAVCCVIQILGAAGQANAQVERTQVVLMDFDTWFNAFGDDSNLDDIPYSTSMKNEIQARMEANFAGFNIFFTQNAIAAPVFDAFFNPNSADRASHS